MIVMYKWTNPIRQRKWKIQSWFFIEPALEHYWNWERSKSVFQCHVWTENEIQICFSMSRENEKWKSNPFFHVTCEQKMEMEFEFHFPMPSKNCWHQGTCILRDAVFAFKCMTGCVPDYLTSKLVDWGQVSGCMTRNSQQLNIPLFKTAGGQWSFQYRIVSLWNSLDKDLRLGTSG